MPCSSSTPSPRPRSAPPGRAPRAGRCAGTPAAARPARGRAPRRRRGPDPAATTRLTSPMRERLVGADRPAGEDQVERAAGADQPRQPHGAAVDERHAPAPAEDAEGRVRRRRPAGRTRSRARGRPRRRTPRSRRSPACRAAAGSGPSARRRPASTRLPAAVPIAFRSAPAQNVPPAPVSTATVAAGSASKARKASASAAAVGPSTALRASGRSMTTVVTGPSGSMRTLMRTIVLHGPVGRTDPPAWGGQLTERMEYSAGPPEHLEKITSWWARVPATDDDSWGDTSCEYRFRDGARPGRARPREAQPDRVLAVMGALFVGSAAVGDRGLVRVDVGLRRPADRAGAGRRARHASPVGTAPRRCRDRRRPGRAGRRRVQAATAARGRERGARRLDLRDRAGSRSPTRSTCRTPPVPESRQGCEWRWRWDLNPRWACTHTRFRGVLLRPLGHATAGKVPERAHAAESDGGSSGGLDRWRRAAGRGPARRPAPSTGGPNRPPSSASAGGSKLRDEAGAGRDCGRVGVVLLTGGHRQVPGVHGHLVERDEGGDRARHLDGPAIVMPSYAAGSCHATASSPSCAGDPLAPAVLELDAVTRRLATAGDLLLARGHVNASARPPMWSHRSRDRVVGTRCRVAELRSPGCRGRAPPVLPWSVGSQGRHACPTRPPCRFSSAHAGDSP